MTDLDICKRIAEIEGFEEIPYEHLQMSDKSKFVDLGDWNYLRNPLTDKALCFDLMVKHRISFEEVYSIENGESEGFIATWLTKDFGFYKESHDKNPQRAICLAIIAKHEGKNNG